MSFFGKVGKEIGKEIGKEGFKQVIGDTPAVCIVRNCEPITFGNSIFGTVRLQGCILEFAAEGQTCINNSLFAMEAKDCPDFLQKNHHILDQISPDSRCRDTTGIYNFRGELEPPALPAAPQRRNLARRADPESPASSSGSPRSPVAVDYTSEGRHISAKSTLLVAVLLVVPMIVGSI